MLPDIINKVYSTDYSERCEKDWESSEPQMNVYLETLLHVVHAHFPHDYCEKWTCMYNAMYVEPPYKTVENYYESRTLEIR